MRTFLALAVLALTLQASPPAPLTVSAAASLTNALEEAGRAYRAAGGGQVRFNFAASNTLARQIVAGAPVDLFVSADEAQMQLVEQAGDVLAGSRIDLVGNRLVVVTAREAPVLTAVEDLARPAIRRLAIGDPSAVPAGVYAKQYPAGGWRVASGRVADSAGRERPRGAGRGGIGSVDAAVVYESDAAVSSSVRLAFVVDDARAPRIVYPAAVLTRSANRAEAAPIPRLPAGPGGFRHLPAAQVLAARATTMTGSGDPADHDLHDRHGASRDGSDVRAGARARVAAGARALPGPRAARDAGVAATRDAPGGHRPDPPDALLAARPSRAGARGHRIEIVFTWKAVVLAMTVMGCRCSCGPFGGISRSTRATKRSPRHWARRPPASSSL